MMKRTIRLLGLLTIVALMMVGCSNDPAPTGSMNSAVTGQLIVLPAGAELNSATFYIASMGATGQNVNVHRITEDWQEMVVTWNNFNNAYAPGIYGTFNVNSNTYIGVDVTSLVMEWIENDYPNYGLLLDQPDHWWPRSRFYSRETAQMPYLELCYTLNGEEICEDVYAMEDAFVWEPTPDYNYGDYADLYTGSNIEGLLWKRTLVKFDIQYTFEDGCSLTIGFWKTHAGFGPQADVVTPLLPIWLGTAGGTKSLAVTTAEIAHDVLVMKTYGVESNGITKLYAQLLGAKLNFASGAGSDAVDDIVSDADAFLADHDWTDWAGLSDSDRNDVMYWQGMLDDYNNGYIGPGHCVDDDEEEEEEDDD